MIENVLFKGKTTDTGRQVKGNLAIIDNKYFIFGEETIFNLYEVDPESVCQYIGLNDRNDRKIFTLDVIRDCKSGHVGVVEFGEHNKGYGYYIRWVSECYFREDIPYWIGEGSIEVIGDMDSDLEAII